MVSRKLVRRVRWLDRLIMPVLRLVLSQLVGWRYDRSPGARQRLVTELPVVAFRRAT